MLRMTIMESISVDFRWIIPYLPSQAKQPAACIFMTLVMAPYSELSERAPNNAKLCYRRHIIGKLRLSRQPRNSRYEASYMARCRRCERADNQIIIKGFSRYERDIEGTTRWGLDSDKQMLETEVASSMLSIRFLSAKSRQMSQNLEKSSHSNLGEC